MEFNDKWTKVVNDEYRKMIREHKSTDEIVNYFGDLIKYHPKKKYSGGLFTYEKFILTVNEIKYHPNYINFGFNYFPSKRFKDKDDIYCFFNINNVEYILILEYLIENNSSFKNKIVYNIFFTTKYQYEIFDNITKNLSSSEIEKKFLELQEITEKETNKGDIIKIFNSLSYILLKMSSRIKKCVYMISETENIQKINFYKKSIEDSFDNYDLIIDISSFIPDKKSYYYIIKKD